MAFVEKKFTTKERRSFQINIGLEEGYGTGIKHTPDKVLDLIGEWMKGRMIAKVDVLTGGTLIPGTMVYAWNSEETGIKVNREDTVAFVGEVSPLYSAHLSDERVVELLADLAAFIGNAMNQSRMYVMYKNEIRIYQNDMINHPTKG